MSSGGITFDDDSPFVAMTVKCGLNIFSVFRGEMQGVENTDDHVIQVLVMPPPLANNHITDLDKHPELATKKRTVADHFLSGKETI